MGRRSSKGVQLTLERAFQGPRTEYQGERPWQEFARCKEMDPDLFFPTGTTGPALLQIEAAQAICRKCLVREECLWYALDTNTEYGIWGGATEEERRYMRRGLGLVKEWKGGYKSRPDRQEVPAGV